MIMLNKDDIDDAIDSTLFLKKGEHQAKEFLKALQAQEKVKKCYMAKIHQHHEKCYEIYCEKNSFVKKAISYNKESIKGCPKKCLSYESKTWRLIKKSCNTIYFKTKWFLKDRWNEFLKLSSVERIFIILVFALIMKAMTIYDTGMTIIKSIK